MDELATNLIRPDKYQVFLMTCPASLPLSFASHPWFVANKKGVVTRWGVGWKPERYEAKERWGHLSMDNLPPFQGLRVLHFTDKLLWKSSLIKVIEGDENSIAEKMVKFIEESPKAYPYKDTYSFLGPNSNTYAQWVINSFPELCMRLPWNSFGRGTNWKSETK
jgi:hypothetical protein